MNKHLFGFTLIELLIAITIVGILTSIAIPSYQKYTHKARYTEIVQATGPFKLGVEECYQTTGDLNNCQPGKNGVPKDIDSGGGVGLVDTITTNKGVIRVTPRELKGIKATDTYILKPTPNNNFQLIWEVDGGGKKAGYVS